MPAGGLVLLRCYEHGPKKQGSGAYKLTPWP